MKGKKIAGFAAAVLVIFLIYVPLAASQQAYPAKPVMTIVAYPAGGETDIGARIVAGRISTVRI